MRLPRAAVVLMLSLTSTLGCGDDPPPSPRGADNPQGALPPSVVAPASDPFAPPAASRPTARGRTTPSPPPPSGAVVAAAAQEAPPAAPVDYSPQLRAIAGDPSTCGSLGDAPGGRAISLSATVSVTGVVIRASVGGNIPAETRECLERRITSSRFAGPIEGGPRTVSARLELTRDDPPVEPEAETPPEALPPGATRIDGPSGMGIQAAPSVPIAPRDGVPIAPRAGVPIGGAPAGQPIQGY